SSNGIVAEIFSNDRKIFSYTISNGVITNVKNTDGEILVSYLYDAIGNLKEAVYLDGTSREYLYENSDYLKALTGIINENGIKYTAWEYDVNGRVINSSHSSGSNKYLFDYSSPYA